MYPRVIRASCPHPLGQLKLFKFVPDKFVQEHNAEGMSMDGLYPRVIRASCPHPLGQLKLFKFVPDKFVQENNAEGMSMYGTIKAF